MTDLVAQSWFWWAVGVVVGLPVVLLALTEVHAALLRRGHAAARPVAFLRTYVVPAVALLLLLTQASGISAEVTWVRVVATVAGFLVLLVVLSAFDVALFGSAREGTWRARMPSIFVDLGRVVLVGVGLAVLFSWVWGADVGGLFTALGVTSIVLGLALQNAAGAIISGLLLLFEQPFRIGDWLDTGSTRGRVVEVNWRAVHIETRDGIRVVPNAALAGAEFTNLSEPSVEHTVTVPVTFATSDPPDQVRDLLLRTAADVPALVPGEQPGVLVTGAGGYEVQLRLRTFTDAEATRTRLLGHLWYAARRAGLHLDGDAAWGVSLPTGAEALQGLTTDLRLDEEQVTALADRVTVERYAEGEVVQRPGVVPAALQVVLDGAAALAPVTASGRGAAVARLERGAYLSPTALTRETATFVGTAVTELTVVNLPVDVMRELVQERPDLGREVGAEIDRRRALAAPLPAVRPASRAPSHTDSITGRAAERVT
ncbi:mechanosensitive ion channel domain-containing protein [Promicromonospora sp. NPDC052451]|uniref:mechanosensitive ion channel domain-containing protein n=1 Tax=Promicromonospora sp. NPDC052451 TaxID=3364407 RepID=UPI0037CB576D